MIIAEAPPPPLQIAAAPILPLFCPKTFIKVTMILTPEQPKGCPNDTAPPFTLIVSLFRPKILAFAKPFLHPFAIWGAGFLMALLILYRYLFSLTSVRNKLHVSSFHFFLYLCAFEIIPLLILYKLIVQYFGGTY